MSTMTPTTQVEIPVFPPDEWFVPLDPTLGAYDVIVEPNGHVHGYPAATWNDCHLSYPDGCVTPPRSMTDYALFKVGQVTTASGAVVRTGPLTLRGGHAPTTVSRQAAQRYYDDTNSAFADVNIGENELGIWINGALRPGVTPAEMRAAMASGFSGDWREWQGNLELIAFSAVNTPGFRRKSMLREADERERMQLAASAGLDGEFGALVAQINMPRQVTHAGATIRALDTGRFLLTQRSWFHGDDEATRGKWEFPGGGLKDGEQPEDGALREFAEETGLTLPENWRIVGDYPNGTYMHVLIEVPNEGWSQGASMLANEVIGIGWFDGDKVPVLGRPELADFDADAMWEVADDEPAEMPEPVLASVADRIAASIGRSYHQRRAELRARVHGGQ